MSCHRIGLVCLLAALSGVEQQVNPLGLAGHHRSVGETNFYRRRFAFSSCHAVLLNVKSGWRPEGPVGAGTQLGTRRNYGSRRVGLSRYRLRKDSTRTGEYELTSRCTQFLDRAGRRWLHAVKFSHWRSTPCGRPFSPSSISTLASASPASPALAAKPRFARHNAFFDVAQAP